MLSHNGVFARKDIPSTILVSAEAATRRIHIGISILRNVYVCPASRIIKIHWPVLILRKIVGFIRYMAHVAVNVNNLLLRNKNQEVSLNVRNVLQGHIS